jgi:putative membrane protein
MRLRRLHLALLLVPASAFAQGEPGGVAHWSGTPAISLPLAITALLYAIGWLRMRAAGAERSLPWWQGMCFVGGWMVLFIALLSPLHELGEVSLTMHMLQHELLMVIAAPLIVLGRPLLVFLWALPMPAREASGRVFRARIPAAIWTALSAPLVAWLAQAAGLLAWHLPPFYDAALESEALHAAEHATFFFTALLFWWTLIHGRRGRMGYGAAMGYVFATGMYSGALGALMTVAPRVLYASYDHPSIFGMSGLEDQQLAGLIMWVPAGAVLVLAGIAMVLAWMKESERAVQYSSADTLLMAQKAGRDA